jgi:hypothetical protein
MRGAGWMHAPAQTAARHCEFGTADGPARPAKHLDFKNRGVKSAHLKGLIEKIAHFQIGNSLVLSLESNNIFECQPLISDASEERKSTQGAGMPIADSFTNLYQPAMFIKNKVVQKRLEKL